MSFLRDVWADLVEKRLWPVAVVLALAVVALPVLALKSAPAVDPPAPMADVAGPAHLVTDPAAIASSRPDGPVTGEVKNPFRQQHVPKKASQSAGSSRGAPTAAGEATPAGGSGGRSGGDAPSPGGGGSTPRRPKAPAAKGEPRIKVRFGPSDGRRRVRTLPAGTALPSATNPTLVFVEVGRGNRIEFIVSSDAVPQGDGTCKPSQDACAQLFVRPGDTQFFDVTRASGAVVQYQLDVIDVVE